jgi:glycosyltransferase involved in cell wall biosynthesis
MKILSVSNCPLEESQGSGYVIGGYARRLRARGHEVVLLGPEDYEWGRALGAGKRARVFSGYSWAALRRLRRESFDVVELWGAEAWWVMRRITARRVRPLLVARSNGLEPHMHEALARHAAGVSGAALPARKRLGLALFERWQRPEEAFRRADLLTTVSEFDRRFALARGYQPADRVLALGNPLPDDWLGQTPPAARAPVIGFFGSWIPRKGAGLLPDVLPAVLRAHPEWRARLVGPGEAAVRAFAGRPGAERIEVVPFERDRTRLRELYRGLSVVVVPSQFESFGLVAAEAMACGCVLVASPTGFAADLRSDDEAVIVPSSSPAAWIAALDAVLRDAPRRERLARAGAARAQGLRWEAATSRLLETYQRILDARSAR